MQVLGYQIIVHSVKFKLNSHNSEMRIKIWFQPLIDYDFNLWHGLKVQYVWWFYAGKNLRLSSSSIWCPKVNIIFINKIMCDGFLYRSIVGLNDESVVGVLQ